jgi:hypothetical protein
VQQALGQINRSSQEFRDRMTHVNYFMMQRNLPEDLQRTIRNVGDT